MDLRGFGDSTYNTPIKELDDFAEDVHLFIKELGMHKVTLAGWSLGGMVSMLLAAKHPDDIENLVLISSVGLEGHKLYKYDEQGHRTTEPLEDLSQAKENPQIRGMSVMIE